MPARIVTADPGDETPGMRRRQATRLVFLLAGVATAGWAGLVPFARARLAIDDGRLGLLLLCLGAGSIMSMPLAGRLTGRFGCRRVIAATGVLLCASLPLLAVAPNCVALGGALLLFGASLGALDVVVNVQAIRVERDAGRPLMSGFHGLYSAGGVVGAGGLSALLLLGLRPIAAIVAVITLLLALLLMAVPHLAPRAAVSASQLIAPRSRRLLPPTPVIVIGLLCAACFVAEGAVVDWSALLLSQTRRLDVTKSGLGYAAFSATMTAGRLGGDTVVRWLGGSRVLVAGSLLAVSGLLVVVLSPNGVAAILGFGVVGAGSANLVPLLMGAAGRQKRIPESDAVAAAGTIGYAGLLVGPALLGSVSRSFGLPVLFLVVALLLLTVPLGRAALTRMAS